MLPSHDTLPTSGKCTGTCLSAAILTVLLPLLQFFHDGLLYRRDLIADGEIWRLWTGNLVHTNHWHLLMNVAGLWILVFISPQPSGKWTIPVQILFLTTCVGSGLWLFSPEIIWYAGFSGVLYGLFLLTGIHLLLAKDWLPASIILLGVCGKTLWDWQAGGSSPTTALIEAPVVYAAHLYGMMGGGVLALPAFHRFTYRA